MNRFYFEVINNFLLKKREREREEKLVGVGGAWRIRGGKKKAREPTMSWGHLRSCHSGSHYRLAWAQIGTSKAKEPRATPIGVKFQFHPFVSMISNPGWGTTTTRKFRIPVKIPRHLFLFSTLKNAQLLAYPRPNYKFCLFFNVSNWKIKCFWKILNYLVKGKKLY